VQDLEEEQYKPVASFDQRIDALKVPAGPPLPPKAEQMRRVRFNNMLEQQSTVRTRIEASKPAMIRKAMQVYASSELGPRPDVGDEPDSSALDWLVNDVTIFLAGYLNFARTDAQKQQWNSTFEELNKANDHKKPVLQRCRLMFEAMCKMLTKAQAERFAMCVKVRAADVTPLIKRCVPESGPMRRWNWKAKDAICSRIKASRMPSTMDALKEQILSDIAMGP
jgi:hypothetical protein